MFIFCLLLLIFWNLCLNSVTNFQDSNNEALFGIMEKTLQLLEMGFTENEISAAFEKCGEMIMQIGKIFHLVSSPDGTRKIMRKVR